MPSTPSRPTQRLAWLPTWPTAWHPTWRRVSVVLALLTLAIAALAGTGWWWAGQPNTLPRTLTLLESWLPEGHTLQTRDAHGSLRHGGHIGWLRWSSPSLSVEAHHIDTAWQLAPLVQRALHIDRLHIRALHIRTNPDAPRDTTPASPPQSLALPLGRIELPLHVDLLTWDDTPNASIRDTQAHYRYANGHHHLRIHPLYHAQGRYTAQARLQAHAPLALEIEVQADIHAPLLLPTASDASAAPSTTTSTQPSSTQAGLARPAPPTLHASAQARIHGTLATRQAQIHLHAQAQAQPGAATPYEQTHGQTHAAPQHAAPPTSLPPTAPPSATLNATLHPWQPQPLAHMQAEFQGLDISLFLPTAPHTRLHGSVQAGPYTLPTPEASTHGPSTDTPTTAWSLHADLTNATPGPWDAHRLPLRRLQAHLTHDQTNGGTWQLHHARIDLPRPQDGHLQATGHHTSGQDNSPAPAKAQARVSLHALNPASLWTALDSRPLSGTLSADLDPMAIPQPPTSSGIDSASPTQQPEPQPSTPGHPHALTFAVNLHSTGPTPAPHTSAPLPAQAQRHPLTLHTLRVQGTYWAPPSSNPPTELPTQPHTPPTTEPGQPAPAPANTTTLAPSPDHRLHLHNIHLHAQHIQLRGQSLEWLPGPQQLTARALDIRLPGLAAQLDGHITPHTGQGKAHLDVTAAAPLHHWLGQLTHTARQLRILPPAVVDTLHTAHQQSLPWSGQGQAQLQWRGGWQSLLPPPPSPKTATQATTTPTAPATNAAAAQHPRTTPLHLIGHIHLPTLRYTPGPSTQPSPAPLHHAALHQFRLEFQGNPRDLRTQLSGQAQWATLSPPSTTGLQPIHTHTLHLDTALHARTPSGQDPARHWHARIPHLRLHWLPPGSRTTGWHLDMPTPLTLSQQGSKLQLGAGELLLTPPGQNPPAVNQPASAPASLRWQASTLHLPATQANSTASRTDATTTLPLPAMQTRGQWNSLPLAWLDTLVPGQPLAVAGIHSTLMLQGSWDIDTTVRPLRAHLVLERASGDLQLSLDGGTASLHSPPHSPAIIRYRNGQPIQHAAADTSTAATTPPGSRLHAGIQAMRLEVVTRPSGLHTLLQWDTRQAGTLHINAHTPLRHTPTGLHWPANAPVTGQLKANMPRLGTWAWLAPPGWRIGGALHADLQLSGTRSAPQWAGHIAADDLSVTSLLDGVVLTSGRLRARLQGMRMVLDELTLHGGPGSNTRILGPSGNLTPAPQTGGTLTASGHISLDPAAPAGTSGLSMDIRAEARALQALVRADRQLSASGTLSARMEQGRLTLRGNLGIDRAALLLADSNAPQLDEDVRILPTTPAADSAPVTPTPESIHSSDAAPPSPNAPDIELHLNLGRDFALQGYGITTRLQGELTITSGPHITGEVRTVQGRYRAWGQSMDVENGIVRFHGPYDNPSLDITAVRPNIAERVGAKVTGTARKPRIALFADKDMPDAEKLSWIVLGRDPTAGGAETALLQQAALALLSGGKSGENFAGRIGLDEIGFKTGDSTNPAASEAEAAAVTLGKRLSSDLYVTYEQGLSGTLGTLYVLYDISRRLTLRGQTGIESAVDLIFTHRTD